MSCQRARHIDVSAFLVDAGAAEWDEFRAHYPACPDCAQEVRSWTRFEGALRTAGVGETGAHPSDDELFSFEESPVDLSHAQRVAIAAHVEGCSLCRNELAVLSRFDFSRIEADESQAPTSWTRFVAALREVGERAFSPLPQPVVALAVLAVLTIPVGLYLWRGGSGAPVEESPPVARIEQTTPARAPVVEPTPEIEIAERSAPPAAAELEVTEPPRLEPELPVEPALQIAEQQAPMAPEQPRAEEALPAAEPAPLLIAALLPSELLLYTEDPLLAGTASMRVVGVVRQADADAPSLQVAAPERVGLTHRASPTLYWYLSEPTDHALEISITAPRARQLVLDLSLPGPHAAGLHALALDEHGVRLATDVSHRWFVAVVVDAERRSRDVVSGGAIRRVAAPQLESTSEPRRAHAYAEAGFWYDAFDQLSRWIAREPEAANLRRQRAALLEQVGLDELARSDRPPSAQ